jgi:hypothetical protein
MGIHGSKWAAIVLAYLLLLIVIKTPMIASLYPSVPDFVKIVARPSILTGSQRMWESPR